ncbi:transporter substrate-binding domain-containing protein [Phyllobacterium sp. SB3]|uniref:transporter substrate-binding domain-containing protein n=1 Tax=Phyllobacterium sp. SB3 TaxID=3156073 RepID=UPI0032AFD701
MNRLMSWVKRSLLASMGIGLLLTSSVAHAQTVDDLVQKGRVSIGVLTGVPPYTGVDSNGKDDGFHVDVAKLIAKYLGVEVDIVPVTNASRIAALQSGNVDILVAHMGPTPERAKSVMFTMPYAGYNMSIIGKKDVDMKDTAALAHKRIAVPRGGVQDVALTALKLDGLEIVRFDDDATAIQAALSGQVDGVSIGDTVANMIIKQNPGANLEVKFPLFWQGFSIGVRKDAFDLRQWLNNFVYYTKLSGELDASHQKWIGVPLGDLPSF